MFSFLRPKPRLKKLQDQYRRLLEESHRLSTHDRRRSDEVAARAAEVLVEIERLEAKDSS